MLRLLVKVFSISASIKGLALGRSFYFTILSLLWMICEFHLIWARIIWSYSKRSRYFWRKKNFPKNEPKIGLCELLKKHYFFLNLVYGLILNHLLYYYTNSMFGKYLVPEILVEIVLANQILGYLNQLYL